VIFSLLVFHLSFYSNVLISWIHSPLNNWLKGPSPLCQRSKIWDQTFLSVIFEKLTSQLYECEEFQAEIVIWNVHTVICRFPPTDIYIHVTTVGGVQSVFLVGEEQCCMKDH
jgi:hypothetical protein